MKTTVFILLLGLLITDIHAEGTKQLRPTQADYGNVEINDQGRSFALESNSDSLHRLYFHIKNISEKLYFGFQPQNRTLGTGTFRIKNPSGSVVYDRTNIPVATGIGFIESYDEAVAGPKIGGNSSNGYNPFLFSPATIGDFYIEFTTTLSSTYHFDLFDLTVVDASNNPINGRVWSYAWDLSTQGGTNQYNATMYVYTSDHYTTAVDFNGMQPWGFVVSCNSKGTQNTGDALIDRQSVEGNHTYPEYKVFLNRPDPNVYPDPEVPTMIEDLSVIGTPLIGSDVLFYLNMNKSGVVEIFLDIDGISGYQANNKDVVLVKNIKAGGDTIIWNGLDFKGDTVTQYVMVGVTSRFSTGVTHLPIYDPEFHPNGYIVNRITPINERAVIYWDDSRLSGGTINLTGASGDTDGHNFPYIENGFGNLRSMNTWWNGYENNDLKSFSFSMDGTILPISLIFFKGETLKNGIELNWQTLCELNNKCFIIEKSKNGIDWLQIGKIQSQINSDIIRENSFIDYNPFIGENYYRLKQIDINGNIFISNFISIIYTSKTETILFPNPCKNILYINFESTNSQYKVLNNLFKDVSSSCSLNDFSIDVSDLPLGIYYLQSADSFTKFIKE